VSVRRRLSALGLLVAVGLFATARPSAAQTEAVPAAYGLFTGAVAGVYVTTGIFVAKARTGKYLYSLDDAIAPRWELVPVVVMPIGGLVLGLADDQRLANSLKWAGAGFAAGAAVGVGVGSLFHETGEGQWAGAVIGSAAGLLAGSIYGALSHEGGNAGNGGAEGPVLSLRIPF
jgi:hypothetical protein